MITLCIAISLWLRACAVGRGGAAFFVGFMGFSNSVMCAVRATPDRADQALAMSVLLEVGALVIMGIIGTRFEKEEEADEAVGETAAG